MAMFKNDTDVWYAFNQGIGKMKMVSGNWYLRTALHVARQWIFITVAAL